MQFMIAGSTLIVLAFVPLVLAIMQKSRRRKVKHKEELALKGIMSGIGQRLYAAHPGSKWRWVCCPAGFVTNGGITRIEVIYASGDRQFMDVCLSVSGYMAIHVLNVAELSAVEVVTDIADNESIVAEYVSSNAATAVVATNVAAKPHDKETINKWYNIILINSLTTLIDDLNASGEVCLYIGADGKAYVENGGNTAVVHDFGELPDSALWNFITERLGQEGLFAETQEGERIFISWA